MSAPGPRRKIRRVECECGHRSYLTKQDARIAMGRLVEHTGTTHLSVYRCGLGEIHVGHMPRAVRLKYKFE